MDRISPLCSFYTCFELIWIIFFSLNLFILFSGHFKSMYFVVFHSPGSLLIGCQFVLLDLYIYPWGCWILTWCSLGYTGIMNGKMVIDVWPYHLIILLNIFLDPEAAQSVTVVKKTMGRVEIECCAVFDQLKS